MWSFLFYILPVDIIFPVLSYSGSAEKGELQRAYLGSQSLVLALTHMGHGGCREPSLHKRTV